MSETTYTHTIDKEVLFDRMRQHVMKSREGNDLTMEAAFASEEDAKDIDSKHLDVSIEISNIAFEIADMLLTDELRSEFMENLLASEVAK